MARAKRRASEKALRTQNFDRTLWDNENYDPADISFLNNENIKRAGIKLEWTEEQLEEIDKCTNDILYFCENYVKIVHADLGVIQFKPFEYQKRILRMLEAERFVIGKLPRQMGKSTIVAIYFLWYTLFHNNVKVAILANKGDISIETLDRYKLAYENLPKWLQQGVVVWNRKSITLENKSVIKASTTSSSAIRGGTYNIIFLDEFAHVEQHKAAEFYTSSYPTISSGKTTKVFIFSTPKGLNMFYRIWTDAVNNKNLFKTIEAHWSENPNRDEVWKEQEVKNIGGEDAFRQEYECDFIGSQDTLIHIHKLKTLTSEPVIHTTEQGVKIYEGPRPGRIYVMTVDTSRGEGHDYSAFLIFDITKAPYKVVAAFRDNEIPPMLLPNVLYLSATMYNNAWVLIEINDIGGQVADILHTELEYENILQTSSLGKRATLDSGFGKGNAQLGVRTTKSIKALGCSVLKNLIEYDKLIPTDANLVQELITFVRNKASFQADKGYTDDLVMCGVQFAWLTTEKYFKELTNLDLRSTLFKDRILQMEEEITPFGVIDRGAEGLEEKDEDGCLWTKTETDSQARDRLDSWLNER